MRRAAKAYLFLGIGAAAMSLPARTAAIEHDRPGGQPYEIAGRRIVFTTWHFIRPGQPDWQDADGKSVYGARAKVGPEVLHYTYADRPHGIRIRAEAADRTGPLLTLDRPWEKAGIEPFTILHEDGRFRLWAGTQGENRRRVGLYYESKDGRNWVRPNLGLVEFAGAKDNNLLAFSAESVFKDPTAPPSERYKCVWHGSCDLKRFEELKKTRPWSMIATEMDPGKVHAILGAVSPDGLNWTTLPDPLSIEPSDTHVVAYRDEKIGRYVMYTRSYMVGTRAPGFDPPSPSMYQLLARRAVGRTESKDFRAFPPAETIIEPGPDVPPTDQIYSNCRTTIPGAPDHPLLFPAVFHLDDDTTSIDLHASYDGRLWHRLPGSPVLRTANYGQWDGGCIFSRPDLIELPNGDWALPYAGYTRPHKYPHGGETCGFGLALWPKGRLVALEAADVGGFTTEAVVAPGSKLRINAVTARAGSIRIEAADLDGKPIAGRTFEDAVPIVGDQLWSPVKWKSADDLGIKPRQAVVLRFRMQSARIYGLEFCE